MKMKNIAFVLALTFACVGNVEKVEKVTQPSQPSQPDSHPTRPYEFEWANRTHDDHEPVLRMEDAAGWRVETSNSVASVASATDRALFGKGVLRLTYRATGEKPVVRLLLNEPLSLKPFDTFSLWVYGNSAYYISPHSAPCDLFAFFADADGKVFSVKALHIYHTDWFLAQRRLSNADIERVKKGAKLLGFTLVGGTDKTDQHIDLTSFCAFVEELKPITVKPRPKRPNRVFPDAPAGINTGNGELPFPNRALTVIPPVAKKSRKLQYRLPKNPYNWDDLAFSCDGGATWQHFAKGGGIVNEEGRVEKKVGGESRGRIEDNDSSVQPSTSNLQPVSQPSTFNLQPVFTVTTNATDHLDVTYRSPSSIVRFHEVGQSLVIDLKVEGDQVAEVRFGGWQSPKNPRQFQIPYLTYDGYAVGPRWRPKALMVDLPGGTMFHLATMDWTQSNASEVIAIAGDASASVQSNGGTRYLKRTDGKRNPCVERFVYSFADRFEDVLPSIPNPPSPYKHIAGSVVWRSHGAGNREKDKENWRKVRARGLRHILVTDHEVGWRDGNESYTFRTIPAPGRGGDKGQFDYARVMIDELGFHYGPYNNFTDFAPINGNWREDRVSRNQDLQFATAWNRCYAPKPTYGVEACEELTPIIQRKFNFNTAYCDVHTTFAPWHRTDYDARIPGGGTFANTFYTFGEIMLIQKRNWKGPVYSEGGMHYMYAGLADGNYAQDQSYRPAVNPWLVDFDLLRIHPLSCNFGMGYLPMFYPHKSQPKDNDIALDRFLAATIAFGHPGFLVREFGDRMMDRSYFMIQQLAARYTMADAVEIRYLEADGNALNTSAALITGAYRRSQIVTRYSDGTITAVNGSTNEMMRIERFEKLNSIVQPSTSNLQPLTLPPNGYLGISGDGKVVVYSGLVNGHRIDYAKSPEYIYLDGRGHETTIEGITATNEVVRFENVEKVAKVEKVEDVEKEPQPTQPSQPSQLPQTSQPSRFTEDLSAFQNPGQGWSTMGYGRNYDNNSKVVNIGQIYDRFSWRDFEPKEGEYNWSRLDNMLAFGAKVGLPVSFRIMCVNSGAPRGDSPDWLWQKGAKHTDFETFMHGKDGVVSTNTAPIFDDPIFLSCHRRFIEAMGKRYDGDPRLGGIDLGSYGNWGEWHCHGLPPNIPTTLPRDESGKPIKPKPDRYIKPLVYPLEVRKQYVDMYLQNFRKTPIVFMTDDWECLKYALGVGVKPSVGLRRDGVGSPWHFTRWIGAKPYDAIPRMGEVWKDCQVWFEFFGGMKSNILAKGWDLPYSIDWTLTNHVSVVNTCPGNPASLKDDETYYPLLRHIDLYAGARLVPTECKVKKVEKVEGVELAVTLSGVNKGVAPIHLPYDLVFALVDKDGKEMQSWKSKADVHQWLPGPFAVTERLPISPSPSPTSYSLVCRLEHRGGVFKNFRFAALESLPDRSLPLATIAK